MNNQNKIIKDVSVSGECREPFVANQHDDHVGAGVLLSVLQPSGQVVEGVTSGEWLKVMIEQCSVQRIL